ncbi:MAG: methylated-DNA--[protein]-cysteine S-methyltransferase [Acidimicrobiales bacterium]
MTADPIEEQLRHVDRDPIGASQVMAAAIARAEREGLVDVAYTITDTPIGPLLVAATEAGLVRVAFETEDLDQVLAGLAERIAPRVLASPARLDPVRRELDEYFHGRRQQFDVPLDWRLSSGFRRTVLEHLRADVPYGQTVSYGDLATMAGNPKAARAVGTAMATNPIPIVVPCHRVLRTGGNLGGYGGGLALKVALLHLESGAETLF